MNHIGSCRKMVFFGGGGVRRAAIFDLAQCRAGPFRPCNCYPV